MIVVMQCAGNKEPNAGHMLTESSQKVRFVAHPACAPLGDFVYAHPDDDSGMGAPWRMLLRYNESPGENSLGLLRAFELYENDVYRRLARHVGIDNFFISKSASDRGVADGVFTLEPPK